MEEFIKFMTDNLVWVIVIAVAFAVIVAVLVIVLALGAKRKKRRLAADADNEAASAAAGNADIVYDATPIDDAPAAKPADKPDAQVLSDNIPEPAAKAAAKTAAATAGSETEDAAATDVPAEQKTVRVMPKKAAAPAKKIKRPTGKWIIEHKGAGEYASKLCASNGEVMLTSEAYSSENGARTGIGTIVKATETGEFVIYRDKNGNYYYKLKSANNRLLCVGEIYKAKDQCEKAVESVKRIAADAIVTDDVAEGAKYVEYKPAALDEAELKRGARGRWRVEPTEDGRFSAKLYANNGQLMLATEEVSSLKRATDAIETVKRNAAQGNFIIDRDKFGRYYYKLRNAQRSVICIGEAYDKLDSCVSAIESVRRFAATSE